jgi:hypothetical protein
MGIIRAFKSWVRNSVEATAHFIGKLAFIALAVAVISLLPLVVYMAYSWVFGG